MDLLNVSHTSKKASKDPKPSVRVEINLTSTSDASFTEVSYEALYQGVVKKSKLDIDKNGLDDGSAGKNDADSLARYYEEKYGGGGGNKKGRDRIQNLADVGYGYDETDPFVDDSECYDEMVPASLTTQLGGFYVNTGKLEFKQVSDEEELALSSRMKKKRKVTSFRFGGSGDEGDLKNTNGLKYKKAKKLNSSLDIDDKRRRKLSLQGKDKLNKLTKGPKKKPTKVQLLVAKARAHQHLNSSNQHSSSSGSDNAGALKHHSNVQGK
uniref:Hpc2-related domain-containing protein n=2 Tax=Ciona savignyi TaxID=51511 RepID=H2YKP8_CIOSA